MCPCAVEHVYGACVGLEFKSVWHVQNLHTSFPSGARDMSVTNFDQFAHHSYSKVRVDLGFAPASTIAELQLTSHVANLKSEP